MTSSEDNTHGGRRYMPYVFTEQGIAMLSVVLKSDIAVEISIKIMNSFVEMRKCLLSNKEMFASLDKVELRANNVARGVLGFKTPNKMVENYFKRVA